MPRAIALSTSLLVLILVAGCDRGPDHPYPAEIVDNFLASCTQKGTKEACQCSIDLIQRRFTVEQFQAMEARMAKGEVPKDLMDAVAECQGR
ncbi:MAG TPA: hypothetical protein VGR62_02980 [Candidatus Binatia bacterium]|jgi:hypothetical protein|nr:hypothetical protein [Candidatus Binatia bacterium]